MDDLPVSVHINGRHFARHVESRTTLADLIRNGAGLTGTHLGCEHGVCGACTVLLDGAAIRACLLLAVQANGCCVTTVESLAGPDGLHPLQAGVRGPPRAAMRLLYPRHAHDPDRIFRRKSLPHRGRGA